MAQFKTVAEIEALSRQAEALSNEYERTQAVVLNLTSDLAKLDEGTKKYEAKQRELEDATIKEKNAKNESKRVQLEYNQVVGDSAQEFKSLNTTISDFVKTTSNNEKALSNLGFESKNLVTIVGATSNAIGANLQKIEDEKRKLEDALGKGDIATANAIRGVIGELEATNKGLAGVATAIGDSIGEIDKIGTSQAKTEIDEGARRRLLADASPLERAGLQEAFDIEDKIVAVNKGFKTTTDQVKKVVSGVTDITDKIPLVGGAISGFINKEFDKAVELAGADLAAAIKGNEEGIKKTSQAQAVFNAIASMNPYFIGLAVVTAILLAIRGINSAARDLANDLSLGRDQLDGQLAALKSQEVLFTTIGLDADKLKTTLTTLSTEFKDLELVTAENAANIERFAQESGVSGNEVAKLTKQLMVSSGLSFDQALSFQEGAAALAKTAGIAKGRILSDIASNAEDFARFSMQGAEGLAEAAVAANQMGLNLTKVMKVAGDLLDFESSITSEFEAQVLTGRALNLEAARQAALSGDQESLMREIKSVAMGVNLETMNVVQKDAIASAIGLSVSDLMRVSRGESLDKMETQIDVQKKTNDILIAGFKEESDKLDQIAGGLSKETQDNIYAGIVDNGVGTG